MIIMLQTTDVSSLSPSDVLKVGRVWKTPALSVARVPAFTHFPAISRHPLTSAPSASLPFWSYGASIKILTEQH